jgi:hypothetical protein
MIISLAMIIVTLAVVLKVVAEFFPLNAPLADSPQSSSRASHYLLDLEYSLDETTGFGRLPHLSVFNPGNREARLAIKIFYQDRDPIAFRRSIPARSSIESNASTWPVCLNSKFALKIESTEPIVAQVTQGWNNVRNDYTEKSHSANQGRPREIAKSSMSITSLSRECYITDGILIEAPDSTWIREAEDVIILNPGSSALAVTIYFYYGEQRVSRFAPAIRIPVQKKKIHVPAERMVLVPLAGWVKPNWHYGARIAGDRPFAAQWLRRVYWYDSSELMSEWSLPCVPIK